VKKDYWGSACRQQERRTISHILLLHWNKFRAVRTKSARDTAQIVPKRIIAEHHQADAGSPHHYNVMQTEFPGAKGRFRAKFDAFLGKCRSDGPAQNAARARERAATHFRVCSD
jgi:hypothetical protein